LRRTGSIEARAMLRMKAGSSWIAVWHAATAGN
jgi:hypothetical protein